MAISVLQIIPKYRGLKQQPFVGQEFRKYSTHGYNFHMSQVVAVRLWSELKEKGAGAARE